MLSQPNALRLGDGHLSADHHPFFFIRIGNPAMIGNQEIKSVNPQCSHPNKKGVLSGMLQTLSLALVLIDSKQESFHEKVEGRKRRKERD